jgi:hypothetical protein
MVMGEFRASGPVGMLGEVQSVYRELDPPKREPGKMNWVRDQHGALVEDPPQPPTPDPQPPAPVELSRAEVAGYRAGRMAGACFQALSETFTPQVAAQLALDLTKTVLATPSGAKILEE